MIETRSERFSIGKLWREHRVILASGVAILLVMPYLPALRAYFISDDFGTISFLYFNRADLSQIPWFLFQSTDGGIYFRPLGQLFYLIDWWMWGVDAYGYHLTNVVFHALNCVLVYALGARLAASRRIGLVSAALFAVMPVHSEAVAWVGARYDVIGAFFYLASFLFFVLYRQRGLARFHLGSLVTFVLAISSKEIAVTLPFVLLTYDLIFNRLSVHKILGLIWRHLPYWFMLGLALGARLLTFGRVGYGNELRWDAFLYWFDKLLIRTANPLALDDLEPWRWVLLALILLVLWFYRSRREVILGVLWIPLVYIATFNSGASERSFYVSSFGLALALSSIFAAPVPRGQSLSRTAGLTGALLLIMAYSVALYGRNQQFEIAGQVAKAIPDQIKANHPTLPEGARLVFTGVPDELASGVLVYITGLTPSFQLAFGNSSVETFKLDKFPLLADGLDRTLFFEVDHRRVRERADLVKRLQERNRCESSTRVLAEWNFSRETLGWEPWNDIGSFEIRDGALSMRIEGNDPYIGSPPLDISTTEMGDIALTMRVHAERSQVKGSIYWLASGQADYSPDLQVAFPVQADGNLHTYRVGISRTGKLYMGDVIRQLRLDPVDVPAEVAIQSIVIFAQCAPFK